MRIKAVAPLRLETEEIQRRQRRYDQLVLAAGAGVQAVALVNLDDPSTPRRLDSDDDIRRSAELVAREALDTEPGSWDLVMPDCVLDPAVGELEAPPVPVVGILRLAGGFLASLGAPFGAVARNAAIAAELARRLEAYGLAAHLVGVEVTGVEFCAVAQGSLWWTSLEGPCAALRRAGARWVINGCSAVDLGGEAELAGVQVVDPARLALALLGAAGRAGLGLPAALARGQTPSALRTRCWVSSSQKLCTAPE